MDDFLHEEDLIFFKSQFSEAHGEKLYSQKLSFVLTELSLAQPQLVVILLSGGWVLTKYHRVNPSLIWLRLGSDNYDILFLLYPLNIPNVSKYIIDTSPSNTFS